MIAPRPFDVVIIGAGPAGSTTAALLAERGQRVLVLEKDEFPRFHIGESLLPAGLPVLERLGLASDPDTFVFKRGARFLCEVTGRERTFRFDEALPGCPTHAWHVERSLFDTRLRDRAVALGAEVRHGEKVTEIEQDSDLVRVRTGSGTVSGRFLVDASGQDRLLAHKHDTAEPYKRFGTVSVFTHFEQVGDATLEEFGADNDIRIVMREEGWGWVIPLPGRRLSVGIVSKDRLAPEQLDQGLLAGPLVTRLTAGATRLRTQVVRNFSVRNSAPSGPRYAAVGDAACFLDPVFSSGVALAMRGGEALADCLLPALEQGREAAPDLLDDHHARMDRAYRTFAALIDRFYNTRLGESMFLGDPADAPMRAGAMSVLAGDVWRDDNLFQKILLNARRRRGSSSAG